MEPKEELIWFVMRDLKRANAKNPAYKVLGEMGLEVFTPMKERLTVKRGRRVREDVPFIQDLLFVHSTKEIVDGIVELIPTLQYRYLKGAYMQPMIVGTEEMERFIFALSYSEQPKYFMPGEITADMCGKQICIVGGPLNGYSGRLLKVRGSKTKRLIVELPQLFSIGVEVEPEYIQFVEE